MSVTVSLLLFFGLALALMLRTKMVGFSSAIVAVIFGFYLSATGAAAPINHFIVAVFGDLSRIH
jgi:hypothetical protein